MAGRILIADDVATNRIILKVKLSRARYDTLHACTRAETILSARNDAPDVILLDQGLPGGGLETLLTLKQDPITRLIPVIVLDGTASRERRMAMLMAGADDCLTKPLDEGFLLALVRSLMRTHASRQELARRQSTMTDMGFSEDANAFEPRAHVALVAPTAETGLMWRRDLGLLFDGHVETRTKAEILAAGHSGQAPDVFVLSAVLSSATEGVRLVSELRSHPTTRNSAIIVHNPENDRDTAVLALDVGADVVVSGAFDAEDIAARLSTLAARKSEMDRLRSSFSRQLDQVMTDPLTGIYNRRYAAAYLNRVASELSEQDQPLALMMIDLDRFKSVNDTYGHMVGDEVLIETAKRLRDNLREHDLLARFGGEEFLIAMPGASYSEAQATASRLKRVIASAPIEVDSVPGGVPVTASFGVSYRPAGSAAPLVMVDLLQAADNALYVSKHDGRNLVTFADDAAA